MATADPSPFGLLCYSEVRALMSGGIIHECIKKSPTAHARPSQTCLNMHTYGDIKKTEAG